MYEPEGDKIVARITVDVYRSGALCVDGDISNRKWAVLALQSAIDAVNSHHDRKEQLIIPAHATDICTDTAT